MKINKEEVSKLRSAVIEEVIQELMKEIDNEPNDSVALPIWRVMVKLRDGNP